MGQKNVSHGQACELTKVDSVNRLFKKSFSNATTWVYDQCIWCPNSNACFAGALLLG